MNRRSFFSLFGQIFTTAVILPTVIISYDPVIQKIIKPKVDDSILTGYKGNEFLECGYIYCPYIPFHRTTTILS